jgi:hypothetical protein
MCNVLIAGNSREVRHFPKCSKSVTFIHYVREQCAKGTDLHVVKGQKDGLRWFVDLWVFTELVEHSDMT